MAKWYEKHYPNGEELVVKLSEEARLHMIKRTKYLLILNVVVIIIAALAVGRLYVQH